MCCDDDHIGRRLSSFSSSESVSAPNVGSFYSHGEREGEGEREGREGGRGGGERGGGERGGGERVDREG